MVGGMSSVLRELVEVQHQLTTLPKDAEAEKYALLARQEELHTRAARLADQLDADSSTQELLAQLADLRWRLAALERQSGSRNLMPRGGAHAGPGREAEDRAESRIEARIARIEVILSERGIALR